MSKCSFFVHTPACRKEKAGIRILKNAIRVQKQEKKQDRLKEIDNDLAMIKSGIEIVENSIKDCNSDLESFYSGKVYLIEMP